MNNQNNYLHRREIANLKHSFSESWQGWDLSAFYFVKSELGHAPVDSRAPVILLPGGFDPQSGDYSEAMIEHLLRDLGASAVYEAHYNYNQLNGYAEPEAATQDLLHILTKKDPNPPLIVGLSGAAMVLAEALYRAHQQDQHITTRAALLVGTFLPSYLNLYGKAMMPLFGKGRMVEKVAKYAGHPYVFDNTERAKIWWMQSSELRCTLDRIGRQTPRNSFPIPVEIQQFFIDTLSRRGQAMMRKVFNMPRPEKPFQGSHRGLSNLKEADIRLIKFYNSYSFSNNSDTGSPVKGLENVLC